LQSGNLGQSHSLEQSSSRFTRKHDDAAESRPGLASRRATWFGHVVQNATTLRQFDGRFAAGFSKW